MSSKVAAMERIASETDRFGGSRYPNFMRGVMEQWQREGLITIEGDREGTKAAITDKGRALAKKAMRA